MDVSELATLLKVTTETVRRDLSTLEQQGTLKRVHGGAIPVERLDPVPDLAQRNDIMAAAKRSIGKHARGHLPTTGSILIDAGTTTARLADAIPLDNELTVVTNATPTAELLVRKPRTTVFLLGGRLRPQTLATVEAWGLQLLENLHVDVAFIGTYGVSVDRGFSTPDPNEAVMKSAMIRCAKKVVVLADRTKLGQNHLSVFASLSDVDVLVTDSGASKSVVAQLREAGLDVELSREQRNRRVRKY